jgi:hypothetical protein
MDTFKMILWMDATVEDFTVFAMIRSLIEVTNESTTIGHIVEECGVGDNRNFAWSCSHKFIGSDISDLLEKRYSEHYNLQPPTKGKQPKKGLQDESMKFALNWLVNTLAFTKKNDVKDKRKAYLTSTLSLDELQAMLQVIKVSE